MEANNKSKSIVVDVDSEPQTSFSDVEIDLTQVSCDTEVVSDAQRDVQERIIEAIPKAKNETSIVTQHESRLFASSPFLAPVRNAVTGLFVDGKYSAAEVKMHINPSSIPVLDTPSNGMLHVITGWNSSELLSDLCYRYTSQGKWDATCSFFRENEIIRKRRYHCNGVLVCPVLLSTLENFEHSNEKEWVSLQSVVQQDTCNIDVMEKRTARNLYVVLTDPDRHFCSARWAMATAEGERIIKCEGKPVIRRVRDTLEWFVGCTDYYKHRQVRPGHYFRSLRTFTDNARGYLHEILASGKSLVIPGDVCQYVGVKKGRIRKRCQTHGETLVESGTMSSKTGKCQAVMILMEQPSRGSTETHSPVTYALCIGGHNHPPPPQPNSTEKKKETFRTFAESAPSTTAAVLQLQTQSALYDGGASPLVNVKLSRNAMYETLSSIRRARKGAIFSSLFEMVGRADEPYVRDVRVLECGVVFLLGTEKMLEYAGKVSVFAGDATFKTVIERNPHTATPDWYLYNIVAPYDPTTATHRSVVVCRALMTSLTRRAYGALWAMFLQAAKNVKAKDLGLELNDVSIDVPYMTMEPARRQNAVTIRAVTIDFEVAEVEGISDEFAEFRGGSMITHLNHLFVGCEVHFERAFLKRANSLKYGQKEQFKKACRGLLRAQSVEEADRHFAIIAGLDIHWSEWLSRSHVRPLVSPPYSKMSKSDRMIALRNTNMAESQNRRGNLICGTGLDPVTCTKKLQELDRITSLISCTGEAYSGQKIPRVRVRNGHTLAPSGTKRMRQKGGTGTNKKRKSDGQSDPAEPRKVNGALPGKKTTNIDASTSLQIRKTTTTNMQGSLLWLHEELGDRCRKAVEEENETLLVALTELYSTVLENEDLNNVKLTILSTMRKNGVDKTIVSEFADLLVLTTKRSHSMDQLKQTNADLTQAQVVKNEDSCDSEVEKKHDLNVVSCPVDQDTQRLVVRVLTNTHEKK